MINVGDKVVYSVDGIGQIGVVLRTETKTIKNKQQEFLVVRIANSSLIVYSPKNAGDIKIRNLSDPINLNAAYHILKDAKNDTAIHHRWDRCVKEAKAMLGFSAPLFGQAECLVYLNRIKAKRKLSFEEHTLLQNVRESFLSEVSEITNKSRSNVETELNQYFN